jgi:hypothetical protein
VALLLAGLGSLIAASGTVPYILATVRKQTKPRVVSWFTWSLLTAVVAAASFADGHMASAIFALVGTLATGAVVVAGLRYGDRTFSVLDVTCQLTALAGLVLWLTLDSPVIAVWVAIAVDFIGFIPTYKHAWQLPYEETTSTFVIIAGGGILATTSALLAEGPTIAGISYPLYVALSMAACAATIAIRRQKLKHLGRRDDAWHRFAAWVAKPSTDDWP